MLNLSLVRMKVSRHKIGNVIIPYHINRNWDRTVVDQSERLWLSLKSRGETNLEQQFVQLHGGSITVESVAACGDTEKHGSVFTVPKIITPFFLATDGSSRPRSHWGKPICPLPMS